MRGRRRSGAPASVLLIALVLGAAPAAASDSVGLVDQAAGEWHLQGPDGVSSFYYGNPGDHPVIGDWDCDGVDTPGLYRRSDGFVYLRNSNTQGVADTRFFFGNPDDVPLAGDFDGDGCDTVALWRPAEARVYVINALGADDGGLGSADYSFFFGNPGDQPFVADFDGDGVDTIGLHRASTGFVYYRNANSEGFADAEFYFGDPGDRFVAGDWTGNGMDTPAVFRPGTTTFYFRHSNTQGTADDSLRWGRSGWLPVGGAFGDLPTPGPGTGCAVFPPDNVWNARIDALPVHARSAQYVAAIGAGSHVHADFGSGVWPPGSTSPIGIPFVRVDGSQPPVEVRFTNWPGESDPGPYPIPPDAPIEGGPDGDGDRHVIVVDDTACMLYELFAAYPAGDRSWDAANGAVFDLASNALRPDGWTSGDAAGLPIYPGLVRYEEVTSGVIEHAIRFTAPQTQKAHVWPARHHASNITDPAYPPMGQRFRLRADFAVASFSPEVQVILVAMKRYGIILADNGSPWYLSGAPDPRWDNGVLHELHALRGSDFEAVDVSSLIVDSDSGAAAP